VIDIIFFMFYFYQAGRHKKLLFGCFFYVFQVSLYNAGSFLGFRYCISNCLKLFIYFVQDAAVFVKFSFNAA